MTIHYTRVAQLKTPESFAAHLQALGVDLPFDAELQHGADSPLAQKYILGNRIIGNRFCVQPMEGWDGESNGMPSELTKRRWEHFGTSGAKLIWGGEAVAVRHDGRANPNQLMLTANTMRGIAELRACLLDAHRTNFGSTDDLYIGLQLTHSGRFSKPNDKKKLEPFILYEHPFLNSRYGLPPDEPLMTDAQIDDLLGDFVIAAKRAHELGFDFVDLKHCHGYLGHEFLSAVDRDGKYGGSFENRTRFLRELVANIRCDVRGLNIGVRVSAFDLIPFHAGADGRGVPENFSGAYPYAFGGDSKNPLQVDLREPLLFMQLLQELNIQLVNITGGSPYYNPHVQRPALFPPSDGYQPPQDPLVDVARMLNVTAQLKEKFPPLAIVGTGYSYLQEWLPHVGQYNVRNGRVDFVGLGRMILAYPELPRDVLEGKSLRTKFICRTFSDCTTGPRNGLVSGCYPLDPFYKNHPEHELLKQAKK